MKRISLSAIVIITITSLTQASVFHYPSIRYRTRWSPYAFSHKTSGLISGYYGYSPYAFSHKSNGIVHKDVRWSPYAFSHKSSGLIYDHIGYSPYAFDYKHSGLVDMNYYTGGHRICRSPVVIVHTTEESSSSRNYSNKPSEVSNSSYAKSPLSRIEKLKIQKDSRKQLNIVKENDGKDIICRYLKSRNIDDFKMTGMLKIEGKVINANFLLKDRNLMITYWDMDEVESLLQQPGYQRKYLEKHEKDWKDLCNQYTQAGGKIYPISSADKNEILAKLTLCSEINGG
ncbi:MAG: hypothetical protein JW837_10800 [Sedimentisphaerales bacterium]|nr:hypothetical protein [Sedimentisphaerales bacterium]